MHFLGGLLVAMIFFWLIWPKLQITNGKALIAIVLVVSFVVFIGVLWEFFEFLYDVFISTKGYALLQIAQQGVSDTMSDLFFDLFGGLAFSLGYKINQKLNLKNQNIKN
ncbi:hypothetical protein HY227_00420 [Candidatus Wolfebacteria bacterium]|nr:hypothetical protein [Candidatus Wolfebacteria bacterium]